MNCKETEEYLSVLCDGETVPVEAAQHAARCTDCRGRLRSYVEMGLEMRLAVASMPREDVRLPPALLGADRHATQGRFAFLLGRVAVPRLVLAAMCVVLIAVSAALPIVKAQTPALWLGFGFGLSPTEARISTAAKSGYKTSFTVWTLESELNPNETSKTPVGIGVHLKILDIAENRA
jgi:hypothetical protein